MNELLSKRITTNETALLIINAFEPQVKIENDKVVIPNECFRCGGSGYGYWNQDGGICYECRGKNTKGRVQRIAVKAYASKIKSKQRAEQRRKETAQARQDAKLESQRDWCDKNGHGRLTFAELNSNKQQERIAKQDAEKLTASDVPTGRHEFTGVVIKTDVKDTGYGLRHVMTLKEDRGFILWGSIPSNLDMFDFLQTCPDTGDTWVDQRTLQRGDRVNFTATSEMSDRDSKFGFYKRPAKAELITAAE